MFRKLIWSVALLLISSVKPVDAQRQSSIESDGPAIHHWGKAINPDGDCTFYFAKRSLLIAVPGGRPHDLAADIDLANAPRVLRKVCGDFTIQVRVEGRFEPGDASTKWGRLPYNGAGLVAMVDAENVVTLARAVLQRDGSVAEPYANFEVRAGGELQRIGMTGDHPLTKDVPTYLRLERRGGKMLGAVSDEGSRWDALEAKEVPSNWPVEMQVGVVAISTSKDEFNPRFSKLKILN
jgi:regulation of enolase protein 1 (concanavalin A-like superfamily)